MTMCFSFLKSLDRTLLYILTAGIRDNVVPSDVKLTSSCLEPFFYFLSKIYSQDGSCQKLWTCV